MYIFLLIALQALSLFASEKDLMQKKVIAGIAKHQSHKTNNFHKPIRRKIDIEEITGASKVSQEKKKHTESLGEIFNFKYDKDTKRRGNPKMLKIYCKDCDTYLMHYQKDGPGRLLRCYLDRIHKPDHLEKRQYEHFDVKTSPNLTCSNSKCKWRIGYPMIYKGYGDYRPAYDMVQERFYFEEIKK
jgi:hypothetical protein